MVLDSILGDWYYCVGEKNVELAKFICKKYPKAFNITIEYKDNPVEPLNGNTAKLYNLGKKIKNNKEEYKEYYK